MLTKRRLLSNVLETLAAIPPADPPASNPLKFLATNQPIKNLFFTLHVLFPTALLPALDLLDRHQIHRFILSGPSSTTDPSLSLPQSPAGHTIPPSKKQRMYLVLSSLSPSSSTHPHPHRHHGSAPGHDRPRPYRPNQSQARTQVASSIASRLYDDDPADDTDGDESEGLDEARRYHRVRLEAGHCSCPGFAFEMFPSGPSSRAQGRGGRIDGQGDAGCVRGLGDWVAPGNGGDGAFASLLRGGETPMCKHLLACLLVERCEGLFGGVVRDREVGVEEWVGWEAGWGG
ncbi:hypothetical protein B9Z65_9070 [Elsinoe australis]|uniref:SWIM-type domain-containing protein n=1 Tax=Elsinoe australis TaxID=40998 RepID=A0A2P8ABQ2_9PEZI|nr:hypothetical protein B9Z65_9070 [Elsinoe australis]